MKQEIKDLRVKIDSIKRRLKNEHDFLYQVMF